MNGSSSPDSTNLARCVTICIQNSTDTSLYLASALLGGGEWEPSGSPVVGQTIGSGLGIAYLNGANSVYVELAGALALSAANGGTINITWAWPSGAGLIQSCSVINAQVQLVPSVANGSTNFPTLTVLILPVSALP
jgi:hypothetical protein